MRWTPVDYALKGGLPEENEPVLVTWRTKDGELFVMSAWLLEDDASGSAEEYAVDFFDAPFGGDRFEGVIAWSRDWPAPYRPEETTDEQR